MVQVAYIADLAQHAGEEVTVRGWLKDKTDKGKLYFLMVRDGTGVVQAVAFQPEVSAETFAACQQVTQESSLIVTGTVRADKRAPGGYELALQDVQIVQLAENYPITPKEHGVGFLMARRHLWLRSSQQHAILLVRAEVVRAVRDFLDEHGYVNVDTPILTPAACEGTSTLFETDYFGEKAYLTQSGQLYNEATIAAFGRVYCFGPTFRAEKSKTRRHLTEFWMVEPEAAYMEFPELLQFEEQLVSYIVQRVLARRAKELATLERDVLPLQKVTPPFPRITYDAALQLIAEKYSQVPECRPLTWGEDLGAPHETLIAAQFDRPVFVTHYPVVAKAFYMQPDPHRPEVVLAADMLAPEGYGEIIGGSQRIHDLALMEQRVAEIGIPREAYEWYLDLRRYGSVPHSGFGMGIERVVAWICGLSHLREAIPFPRMMERIYP
jgi:asparaginyl-tRNA synthetase